MKLGANKSCEHYLVEHYLLAFVTLALIVIDRLEVRQAVRAIFG